MANEKPVDNPADYIYGVVYPLERPEGGNPDGS
jgi:hypothetical protein